MIVMLLARHPIVVDIVRKQNAHPPFNYLNVEDVRVAKKAQ